MVCKNTIKKAYEVINSVGFNKETLTNMKTRNSLLIKLRNDLEYAETNPIIDKELLVENYKSFCRSHLSEKDLESNICEIF